MKKVTYLVIILVLFGTFVSSAFAAVPLSGKLVDTNNNPLIGAKIIVKDPVSQKIIGSAITDYNGSYALSVPDGTYDISVVSAGSKGQESQTFTNQKITTPTSQNLKVNISSNAPIPPQKNGFPYILLLIAVLLLGTLSFMVWRILERRKAITTDMSKPVLGSLPTNNLLHP